MYNIHFNSSVLYAKWIKFMIFFEMKFEYNYILLFTSMFTKFVFMFFCTPFCRCVMLRKQEIFHPRQVPVEECYPNNKNVLRVPSMWQIWPYVLWRFSRSIQYEFWICTPRRAVIWGTCWKNVQSFKRINFGKEKCLLLNFVFRLI